MYLGCGSSRVRSQGVTDASSCVIDTSTSPAQAPLSRPALSWDVGQHHVHFCSLHLLRRCLFCTWDHFSPDLRLQLFPGYSHNLVPHPPHLTPAWSSLGFAISALPLQPPSLLTEAALYRGSISSVEVAFQENATYVERTYKGKIGL